MKHFLLLSFIFAISTLIAQEQIYVTPSCTFPFGVARQWNIITPDSLELEYLENDDGCLPTSNITILNNGIGNNYSITADIWLGIACAELGLNNHTGSVLILPIIASNETLTTQLTTEECPSSGGFGYSLTALSDSSDSDHIKLRIDQVSGSTASMFYNLPSNNTLSSDRLSIVMALIILSGIMIL